MGNVFEDAAAVREVARGIQARADVIHDAVARAAAALSGVDYDCPAARRQREEMAVIASRAHSLGDALGELAADLLCRASGLEAGHG